MQTLFEAFRQSAHQFDQKTALIDYHTGRQISYSHLLTMAENLAHHIKTHCPLLPGDRIGLLMANQIEFIISFFALQALGAVVIPLNYRLSTQEHQTILDNAEAIGLISSADFEAACQPLLTSLSWYIQAEPFGNSPDTTCACFSMAGWSPDEPKNQPELPECSPSNLAVLIYTSGTTGKAKGVMLSHSSLLADARANAVAVEASPDDVFVTTSPLFHVFGLTNMMLTSLLQGATLVLIRRFNPKSTLEAITQHKVTFMAAVPTMYQMMLSLLPSPAYDLSSLRVCHSGAAPMAKAIFAQVEELFGAPVQEGYGQSEASSIITSNPLRGIRKPGSIGLPLQGLTVEIVDENDRPLPPMEIGELRVKGATLMLGYWNNPEATARTLRGQWLYTSDMGYKDEEGYLFLAGRRDDLINVGGAKVYPQEVEEVLYQHPDVESCAVCAEPSDLYHQVVAAFVVSRPNTRLTAAKLQKFCRSHLGEYKVPKKVYFVDEIPKGPTGKILRHQLAKCEYQIQK